VCIHIACKQPCFSVEEGIAGRKTAFVGQYGDGKPVIEFLGEYDALAGMSQIAGLAERVDQIARDAAMMTGMEIEIVFDTAATNR
jgi:metal-dependent amidase/aminoacylase/carboxypeptidase family protein